MKFKEWIKRIIPTSKKEFREKMNEISDELTNIGCEINNLNLQLEHQNTMLNDIRKTQNQQEDILLKIKVAVLENEVLIKKIANNDKQISYLQQILNLERYNKRYNEENNWSAVFHDAIMGSKWLEKQDFCPGRWAIGYQALYVLYRVLNEVRPKAILELGLGQSTKLITQYAAANSEVYHVVVEHDESWIDLFKTTTQIAINTRILRKNLTIERWNGVDGIRVYEEFSKDIIPGKYNLIVIDAPWGGDMKEYARVDVARVLDQCLDDSFVILMDDYNRSGEQATVEYMKKVLEKKEIKFSFAKYEGAKDVAVIVSEDLKYICTL
ncbi:MAG: hypothetical protein KHY39_09935 [Clostridiaceae bacterium]|nr:hypothetical protein [Clostridiaceae bacterium]